MQKQGQWIKIAESLAELTERGNVQITEREVKGKLVCLVHEQGKLYACAGKCPHAGGRLSQGFTDGTGNIICPVHRYKFRLSNGYNASGEGFHLKSYPILENDEGVFIQFPDRHSFL